MIRAQCIVHRGSQILMVKHRLDDDEWWCLPGGGVQPQETPAKAALRELREECHVSGEILHQTGHSTDVDGFEAVTFLVEIGSQEPKIGDDPEFAAEDQILQELRWLTLANIPERDRAYLWSPGLMSIPVLLDEVSHWGDAVSYPDKTTV